jgi:ribosomal-protein-alanine N-acetyltransferase
VQFLASHVPWPYPADGALRFIRDKALPAIQNGTEWHWSIRLKMAPEPLIGVISLMDKPGDNRGFWLDPAWQGRGLMSEASSAVTDFWFETLGRPVLQVPKAAANMRSRRISERTGMRLIEITERDYVSGRLPAEVWEITREEWRKR